MKTTIALALFAVIALFQTGCSSDAGVSVGHEGHTHGVSTGGHVNGSGLGASGSVR